MNYNKKTVYDVDVKGKKVLLRCDFNVPQNKETGEITSNKRIVAAIPTIRYLLDNGAAVIACSHLGKPKGVVNAKYSLAPVAKSLSEKLGFEVTQDTVFDEYRGIDITFLARDGYVVEIVSPKEKDSVVSELFKKIGNSPYHICYETDDIYLSNGG